MEQLNTLLDQLQTYALRDDLVPCGKEINDLKISFEDTLLEMERVNQIQMLEARDAGETIDSTDFSEIKNAFLDLYKRLHEQRKQQILLKDALEKENLKLKRSLIEDLKKIIESEENIGTAFNAYKSIHETWKKVGDIPRDQRDAVQKEYSRLIEIFFYTMRIYREIKTHDYKRNSQNKQVVLHKLQQLRNEEEDIKTVEQQLRTLQDEWEEIGPVQNEEWDALKTKYWEVVRQIYDKINAHYEAQRQVYEKNIEAKKALVLQMQELCVHAGEANSFKTWDALTEKVKSVQEEYKKIGPGARKENDLVWKQFRTAIDAFFELKKNKAKEQQAALSERIEAKKKLILEAEQLKDSTGKEATQRIIQLQKDWKNIGNSGKAENQLWAKFRGACDAFFAAKDAENAAADKALEENYELKLAVIEKIKAFEPVDKTEGLAQLRGFSGEFTAIGHVPASKKDQVYKSYKTALDKAYEALKLNQKEREQWDFKAKLDEMLTSPDRVKQVQRERTELRKNIERLEQEINRMETNLAFFARSKGADSLRAEVAVKVQGIQEQISVLKQRLKLLPNE
ncbi:MAG: hypothetical protein RLZZ68_1610 [Bacteroidota bacterium]|nr:DUF349 domain-containing protein [Flavobacteriia bacterium]